MTRTASVFTLLSRSEQARFCCGNKYLQHHLLPSTLLSSCSLLTYLYPAFLPQGPVPTGASQTYFSVSMEADERVCVILSVPITKSSCVLGLFLALLGGPCDARHCTWCSSPLVISLIFLKPLASHHVLTGLASVSFCALYRHCTCVRARL